MWINLTKEEIETLSTLLAHTTGPDDPIAKKLRKKLDEPEDGDGWAEQAREMYAGDDTQIEDDYCTSESDDGRWVMGWLWVSNEAMGIDPQEDEAAE